MPEVRPISGSMSENVERSPDDAGAQLDWAALLARWMEFARASVALPDDAQGRRWRASISSIITLQAVTLALGELERLENEERAVAIDRASLLIERESQALDAAWDGTPSDEVEQLIEDADSALNHARSRQNSVEG